GLFGVAVSSGLYVMPAERWPAAKFSGDEPKYLRLADSLYHDLDVDLSADTPAPIDWPILRRNVRDLLRATRDALADFVHEPFPDASEGSGSGGDRAARRRRRGPD